ncbi:MAG: hypothetical protein ACREOO_09285, partial [bacterium]
LRQIHLFAARAPGQGAAAGNVPEQPNPLLNGLGFIFGLYFVTVFSWWMVNLQHTFALQQPFVVSPPVDKMRELIKSDPQNFLRLPALCQPYEALLVAASDPAKPKSTSYTVDSSGHKEEPDGASPQTERAVPRSLGQSPRAEGIPPPGLFLPVISVALSGMFLLFIGGIVPLRLMSNILLAVRDREAAYTRRLRQTLTYTGQFFRALIAQNPLFSISSLIVIIFLIVVPLLIEVGGNRALLKGLLGPDQVLFIFTLLAAWLSPVIYAGVQVDRTFGMYFNTKLANLILSMRGHLVVLGFGDLGQRVVKRELAKLLHRETPDLPWWQRMRMRRRNGGTRRSRYFLQRKWLECTVSPELNIERMCNNVIVVDRNSDNFVFAASGEVLGSYGVVSAWEKARAFNGNRTTIGAQSAKPRREQTPRQRILVPVIQGDATEPFTLARVNLDRARFLISMVSQEERVREIFTHAAECGLRAIICVSRSDQINNLTYKAARYPITLVYPKQHSGLALGQRLLAAVLKVKSRLPADREYPRILVIGLNKSNHFMLETLWHSWPPLDDRCKAEIFADMLRFVVTDEPPRSATLDARQAVSSPAPEAQAAAAANTASPSAMGHQPASTRVLPSTPFDRSWRSSYITGFRHVVTGPEKRPLSFDVPTCVMKMDEGGVLERCCNEARPEIIVINDDNASKSSSLLIRCVNTLERLKYEHGDFRFPLILMSAAHGEEAEKRDVGDTFRYYDALTRLYGDYPGPEHPRHAHYRREPPRRLVGDSIHDGLADAEEIISGVRDNWLLADEYQAQASLSTFSSSEVFELNTCLPNVAGALAELAARLAGLEFSYRPDESPEEFFTSTAGRKALAVGSALPEILRPSFQYLRHMRLEIPERGFCLSGYANLQGNNWTEVLAEECLKNSALAARVYAKETGMGREQEQQPPVSKLLDLVASAPLAKTDVKTFVEVMHGANNGTAHAGYCPGMTICPIASFQHYLVASNGKALAAWQESGQNEPLQHAENYGCNRLSHLAPLRRPQDHAPQNARIFCCCHVKRNDPGMVALALNLLNFRRFAGLYRRVERVQNLEDDWIVNLEYFKDTVCQNSLFALNRLFGVRRRTRDLLHENSWTLEDYEQRFERILPLTLIQILPVGGAEVARHWFAYAVALWRFLQKIAPPPRASEPERVFELHWWDQHARRRDELDIAAASQDYPVAIQINNKANAEARAHRRCEFCNMEDEDMRLGCAERRPWMEEDR